MCQTFKNTFMKCKKIFTCNFSKIFITIKLFCAIYKMFITPYERFERFTRKLIVFGKWSHLFKNVHCVFKKIQSAFHKCSACIRIIVHHVYKQLSMCLWKIVNPYMKNVQRVNYKNLTCILKIKSKKVNGKRKDNTKN